MKKLLATLSFAVMAACGGHQDNSSSVKDVVKDAKDTQLLSCANQDGASFGIFDTAVPSYHQGRLTLADGSKVELQCDAVETKPSDFAGDRRATIWSCDEIRDGGTTEGLIHVDVAAGGIIYLVVANVSQSQIFPLGPKYIDQLFCQ